MQYTQLCSYFIQLRNIYFIITFPYNKARVDYFYFLYFFFMSKNDKTIYYLYHYMLSET